MHIVSFTLGPVQTNAYLLADPDTQIAAVVDPAWDGHRILAKARQHGWHIEYIWLTHAHFDHIGGAAEVVEGLDPKPLVALHPADLPLWQAQGGAPLFGMRIDPGPQPTLDLYHGQILCLGKYKFEVRHVPGHTPGHVLFYCAEAGVAFCGDAIFQSSIGRTDLPGGDYDTLIHSLRTQVLTLPDDTRLLCGHGPETTPGIERLENPFLQGL